MYRTVELKRGSLKNVFMVTLTNPSEGLKVRFSGEGAHLKERLLIHVRAHCVMAARRGIRKG